MTSNPDYSLLFQSSSTAVKALVHPNDREWLSKVLGDENNYLFF